MSGSEKNGKKYKYEAVADDLLNRLRGGEWAVGERLPTIEDLAQEYPHSRVTLNRALQLLAEQGYLSIGRKRGITVLSQTGTERIGLLVGPSLIEPRQSPFAAVITERLIACLSERGYAWRRYIENNALLREGVPNRELQEDLAQQRLTGLITLHCNAPKSLGTASIWQRRPLPHVDCGGHHFVAHRVTADAFQRERLVFDHLKGQACRTLAVIGFGGERIGDLVERAAQEGIEIRPEWCSMAVEASSVEENGYLQMLGLWQYRERPGAVLVTDDVMAKGVAQAILKLGLTVPDDIHLLACTNGGANLFYPLSMVRLDLDTTAFAESACDLLFELMRHPDLPPRVVDVPYRLLLP